MSAHTRVRCVVEGCTKPPRPPFQRCDKHRKEHGQHLLTQLDAAIREGEAAIRRGDVTALDEIGGAS